ncbi:MAG: NAD(P)-dependent oxidoreductase [Arenicellales bacterium]|jgi:D-3-phosphoglycerate dehydrogenase|nr:NAD(P)-dependent oxidoreductase [Arenicellales bacterium]
MRIFFADKFPAFAIDLLREKGHSCEVCPELDGDALPDAVADAEILVVRSTRVSALAIAKGNLLRMVIRAGAGTNTIDKAAAAQKNIYVCNVPGRNAAAVAELVMGLIIAIDRNIPDNVAELRAGNWDKKRFSVARGLMGRRMGVVGLGAIGLAVLERAHAFGLALHVIDKPSRWQETHQRLMRLGGIKRVAGLEELVQRCEILSFHVPSLTETRGLIDASLLARMAPGTIIVNTSRGDIIDEPALIAAMDEKGIRAGLDVFNSEPAMGKCAFASALARHPNVYGTHHIGASTEQAQAAVAEGVIEIVDAFELGEVRHCVNMPV